MLEQLGPDVINTLQTIMQGQSPEAMQSLFQQSYVDPAMQVFEQQMIPGIQQRFVDAGAGSSSALNQALAQSAKDLSTNLGAQYGQFQQGQQQLGLQAAGQLQPYATGQQFQPIYQQQQGLAGPLIQGAATVGGAAMMSSEKVKENVRDYNKSLEVLNDLTVKQYDYIESVGGEKDKVGLMAETLPEELTKSIDGILHVDVYGLVGLMINTIQDLSTKITKLEARQCH